MVELLGRSSGPGDTVEPEVGTRRSSRGERVNGVGQGRVKKVELVVAAADGPP